MLPALARLRELLLDLIRDDPALIVGAVGGSWGGHDIPWTWDTVSEDQRSRCRLSWGSIAGRMLDGIHPHLVGDDSRYEIAPAKPQKARGVIVNAALLSSGGSTAEVGPILRDLGDIARDLFPSRFAHGLGGGVGWIVAAVRAPAEIRPYTLEPFVDGQLAARPTTVDTWGAAIEGRAELPDGFYGWGVRLDIRQASVDLIDILGTDPDRAPGPGELLIQIRPGWREVAVWDGTRWVRATAEERQYQIIKAVVEAMEAGREGLSRSDLADLDPDYVDAMVQCWKRLRTHKLFGTVIPPARVGRGSGSTYQFLRYGAVPQMYHPRTLSDRDG